MLIIRFKNKPNLLIDPNQARINLLEKLSKICKYNFNKEKVEATKNYGNLLVTITINSYYFIYTISKDNRVVATLRNNSANELERFMLYPYGYFYKLLNY